MACTRCGELEIRLEAPLRPEATPERRLCAACERSYDAWSRQYAGDVVWEALAGMVIVVFAGMGLPLLGVSWLAAATGVFAGFGAFVGLHRLNARRRRRQYLRAGEIPRAYLPGKP